MKALERNETSTAVGRSQRAGVSNGLLGLYCLVRLIPTGKILYEYIATEASHRVYFVMSYGGAH